MSDGDYTWDLNTPHPNVDLDTLRRATKQAIEDLQATIADVGAAQAAVDDQYWLSDVLFSLLDTALSDLSAAGAERQQLRADITALAARLDVFEGRLVAVEPQPEPDPEVP